MSRIEEKKYGKHEYDDEYNIEHDFKIIWTDYTHIRMLKRFRSKACDNNPRAMRHFTISKQNQHFHLRTYLPKSVILNKGKKIDQCIIMINGLNETKYFTLYDQLGANFARQGIASILLPTPHHFNRRNFEFDVSPLESLFLDPLALYFNAEQSFSEIEILRDKIRGSDPSSDDQDFYSSYFSGKETRISLLGYSLGGLRAVSQFLRSPEKFTGCVLMNSGFKLSDINLRPMKVRRSFYNRIFENDDKGDPNDKIPVDVDVWKTYHDKLEIMLDDDEFIKSRSFYRDIFKVVYFQGGARERKLVQRYKVDLGRVLLIVAGDDKVVPPHDTTNMFSLSTLFRIPGIDHFLTVSPVWANWIGITIDLIIQFLRNGENNYQHLDVVLDELVSLETEWNSMGSEDTTSENGERLFFSNQDEVNNGNVCKLASQIQDKDIRDQFFQLVRAGLCFFGSLKQLSDQYSLHKDDE